MDPEPRILIIDDEEIVLDSCTEILRGRGYQITTADSGARGLELARDSRPDLVFVDLKMPGLSGFEVLEQLRVLDPTIVSIVITGYGTVDSAVEAMKNGAYDFLAKPFTPEELRLIAQRGIEKRRLVSEAMALRREREMLRDNFAAIVSHELKGPLGAMQQNLYVLMTELAGRISEDEQRRLERMKIRLDDLLKLIQTWLRVITVDINRLKESFAPLQVEGLIRKAVETVEPHAARKDIALIASFEAVSSPVEGDEGSLLEVLVNILGNAVKFSPPGRMVHIRAEEEAHALRIAISDSGPGIPPEDLPHLFDFFWSGRAGAGGEGGSGLGLAISRRIVEAHRGTISVESEPGRGSTFIIRLPAPSAEGPARASAQNGPGAQTREGGTP